MFSTKMTWFKEWVESLIDEGYTNQVLRILQENRQIDRGKIYRQIGHYIHRQIGHQIGRKIQG